jgi:hypothetical protein
MYFSIKPDARSERAPKLRVGQETRLNTQADQKKF